MTQWSTDNIHVFDGDGQRVAKLEHDSEHGDFIVAAVNSHVALLRALGNMVRGYEADCKCRKVAPDNVLKNHTHLALAYADARAAIKAAKP